MSVKKIFMTLIVIVMCVILGAFLINILLPNVTQQVVNATETSIFNATGMKFDFNGDGKSSQGTVNEMNTKVGNTTNDKTGSTGTLAGTTVGGFQ